MKWNCRFCGHDSFSKLGFTNYLFSCDGCSVIFADPEKFSGGLRREDLLQAVNRAIRVTQDFKK